MMNWQTIQWGAVLGASLVAALWDLKSRRIPNLLTLPLLGFGLVISTISGGWSGLGESVLSCVVLALPFVFLFLYAGGGAGDAKLMGAIGACLGWSSGVRVLLAVCLAGMVFGLLFALRKRSLKSTFSNLLGIINGFFFRFRVQRGGEPIAMPVKTARQVAFPYGVAILVGVVIAAIGVYRG